jgi:hypothetical protein
MRFVQSARRLCGMSGGPSPSGSRIHTVSVNSVESAIFQRNVDYARRPAVIESYDQCLHLEPRPIRIIRIEAEFPNHTIAVEEFRISVNSPEARSEAQWSLQSRN